MDFFFFTCRWIHIWFAATIRSSRNAAVYGVKSQLTTVCVHGKVSQSGLLMCF